MKISNFALTWKIDVVMSVGVLLLFTWEATGTTLLRKNLDNLVTEADAIVIGTIQRIQSRYVVDREIQTLVTLTDLDVLHGEYHRSSLALRLPGGQVNDDIMVVEGSPQFAPKQRVVLFIQGNGRKMVPLVGWSQGVFRIEQDPRTGKSKITDHVGNPIIEIRGSELLKQEIYAPTEILMDNKPAGYGGRSDNGTEPQSATSSQVSSGKDPLQVDVFLNTVRKKIREKNLKGKLVESADFGAEFLNQ